MSRTFLHYYAAIIIDELPGDIDRLKAGRQRQSSAFISLTLTYVTPDAARYATTLPLLRHALRAHMSARGGLHMRARYDFAPMIKSGQRADSVRVRRERGG